jgi:hypothetical protein
MAAGLGFKNFTSGEVLTAADVNAYLNSQTVMVFADATARTAAITSPQEGMFSYLKDTNATQYYTGSAWTNLDTTGMVNPMTTTGDTIYSSSGTTPARLGIGSTGQVLTVAAGIPSWATPASGGGMTLISTTAITATASVDLTSIPQTYKELVIVIENAFENSGAQQSLTFNNGTSLYSDVYMQAANANSVFVNTSTSAIRIGGSLRFVAGSGSGSIVIRIPNYASTTMAKNCTTNGYGGGGTTFGAGGVGAVAAITSAKITWGGTPSAQGNVLLYGVN